jgi:hypothetical protein
MINNNISQVMNQMKAIESMATSQVLPIETTEKAEGSSFAGMMPNS